MRLPLLLPDDEPLPTTFFLGFAFLVLGVVTAAGFGAFRTLLFFLGMVAEQQVRTGLPVVWVGVVGESRTSARGMTT